MNFYCFWVRNLNDRQIQSFTFQSEVQMQPEQGPSAAAAHMAKFKFGAFQYL